jgi:2,4-dienoyl-CoA reductase-like NADH-dependent reductase (Old Yellow Enzyme family)
MGDNVAPNELTADQIADIVRWFAQAAVRAKKAGYDGVEIHSAHAYLLNQFYSPLTNHRTDAYGGTLDKRLQIHREVIAAVRAAVGDDYLISLRLGGCDYAEGGSTIEDSVYASKVFEAAGVDMLSISGGMCRYTIPGHNEPGYSKEMTLAIKKEVKIPVLLTGGVKTLQEAEDLLAEGAADLIGVGRELMKDPCWG